MLVVVSLEEGLLRNSLVLRNPLAGLGKRVALLVVDALLGLQSHPSRLGEGHAENVVGLHAAADATVAGNRLSEVGSCIRVGLGGYGSLICTDVLGFERLRASGLKFKCQL